MNVELITLHEITKQTDGSKTCHICRPKYHFKRDCPDSDKASLNSSRPPAYRNAKINTCVKRRPVDASEAEKKCAVSPQQAVTNRSKVNKWEGECSGRYGRASFGDRWSRCFDCTT